MEAKDDSSESDLEREELEVRDDDVEEYNLVEVPLVETRQVVNLFWGTCDFDLLNNLDMPSIVHAMS